MRHLVWQLVSSSTVILGGRWGRCCSPRLVKWREAIYCILVGLVLIGLSFLRNVDKRRIFRETFGLAACIVEHCHLI